MTTHPLLRAAVWAAAVLLSLRAAAEERDERLATLEVGDVAALASGPNELFIGTFDHGLVVVGVDGTRRPVRDTALNPHVNALAYDSTRNTLWVATARGVTRCVTSTRWECRRVGGPADVHAVIVLSDGSAVAGGEGGLQFLTQSGAERQVLDRKRGAPFRGVWALAQAGDGTLFVGSSNGLHWGSLQQFRASGGSGSSAPSRLARAAVVTGQLADDWVTALAISGDRVHVGTYNAGLASFIWRGGALQSTSADPALGYINPAGIRPLAGERLAVCTMNGLLVGTPGAWRTVGTVRDVTSLAVESASPGSRAAYWIATRHGVERRVLD